MPKNRIFGNPASLKNDPHSALCPALLFALPYPLIFYALLFVLPCSFPALLFPCFALSLTCSLPCPALCPTLPCSFQCYLWSRVWDGGSFPKKFRFDDFATLRFRFFLFVTKYYYLISLNLLTINNGALFKNSANIQLKKSYYSVIFTNALPYSPNINPRIIFHSTKQQFWCSIPSCCNLNFLNFKHKSSNL